MKAKQRQENTQTIIGLILAIVALVFVGWLISGDAKAHDCNYEIEQQPDCGYVQVVNPVTGRLEQQYVCK